MITDFIAFVRESDSPKALSDEPYQRHSLNPCRPQLSYSFDAEDCELEDTDAEEEVNGNDDESEEEGSSEEDDELEDSVGLGAVYSENLDELSDEADYEAGEEEEEEDGIEEEEDEDAAEDEAQSPDVSRGKKRKLEDGDGN